MFTNAIDIICLAVPIAELGALVIVVILISVMKKYSESVVLV